MKRRKFIQTTSTSIVVPSIFNQLPVTAFSDQSMLQSLMLPVADNDHVMVLIYLGGGNDGLNTVVPLDQMSALAAARPNIRLLDSEILKLNGNTTVGLHPQMKGFQTLFNENKLAIVQSVGYPDPNFSHFRSTDIWTSASDANKVVDTGWLGRYLYHQYPGFPLNYPNQAEPDPLAIQIGSNLPLLFQGQIAQMSMNVSNPDIFGAWPNGIQDPAPSTPLGKELSYIRTISRQSKNYADALVKAFLLGTNKAVYPDQNPLGDALKAIARIIKGGLRTKLYMVGISGFDTHAAQGAKEGQHATLLKYLSDGILAFQQDLAALAIEDRVIGMTFSEFGRRIKDNASGGTDHGAAGPLFLFGKSVQSGIFGNNPQIPSNVSEADNLPMQIDFRTVYQSVLNDWFCVNKQTTQEILFNSFTNLPLIKNNCATDTIDYYQKSVEKLKLKIYPNPVVTTCKIELSSNRGKTLLQLFDPLGRMIKVLYNGILDEGLHHFVFENENYPSGNYYIRVQQGSVQKTEMLMIHSEV